MQKAVEKVPGIRNREVLGSDVEKRYEVVLCLHDDNMQINPHGLGMQVYIRENVCSPKDRQCKRCGFGCKSGSIAYADSNKLVQERVREGFVYDDAEGVVMIIRANAGGKLFSYNTSGGAVEITHRRTHERPRTD